MDLYNNKKDGDEFKAIMKRYGGGSVLWIKSRRMARFSKNRKIFLIVPGDDYITFTIHQPCNNGIIYVSPIIYSLSDFDNLLFLAMRNHYI